MEALIVAIDGPAGSGKSTTARLVARRLGFLYLDTGAMYRALALVLLRKDLIADLDSVRSILEDFDLQLEPGEKATAVFVDGENVTSEIRTPAVSIMASNVAQLSEARVFLTDLQRKIAFDAIRKGVGVVMEGRDIGSVVFPDAAVKVFLVADEDARVERRWRDEVRKNPSISREQVAESLATRDDQDQKRTLAPLIKADDAIELDTSMLTIEEQVEKVLQWVYQKSDAQ